MFIVRIDNIAYDFSQIDLHYGEVIGNIHDKHFVSDIDVVRKKEE